MEALRTIPKHDRSRWDLIKQWAGLSKEAACAWDTLWDMAVNQGTYSVLVHPAAIGESLGAGDRQRTGKRCLEALERHGLIFVKEHGVDLRGRQKGVWLIFMEEPADIQRSRSIRAAAEFQPDLFPDEQKETLTESTTIKLRTEQAVVVQLPPSPRSEVEVIGGVQIERSKVPPQGNNLGDGGDGATTACSYIAKRSPDGPMSDVLAAAMNRLADRLKANWSDQPDQAKAIASRIDLAVNDPNLAKPICLKIAWAIIDGLYPQGKLEAILDRIRRDHSHRSPRDRGMYFIGAMQRSFVECRLTLVDKKS